MKAESGMKEAAMKKGKKKLEVEPLSVLTGPQLLKKMTNSKLDPPKLLKGCLGLCCWIKSFTNWSLILKEYAPSPKRKPDKFNFFAIISASFPEHVPLYK